MIKIASIPPTVEEHPAIREWDSNSAKVTTPLARGRLLWRRWGAGPPLVLAHGGSGSWTHWIRNIGPLSKQYTVWAMDLPGHGDSDAFTSEDLQLLPGEEADFADPVEPHWQPQPIPMPALARAVTRSIETIIPEGKITFVGFSFGGMVLSNVAARIPQRVSRIVLCGAVGLSGRNPAMPPLVSWRSAETAEELATIQRRNTEIVMLHDPARVDDLAVNIQIINTQRTLARKPRRKPSTLAALRKALGAARIEIAGVWGEQDAEYCHNIDGIRDTMKSLNPAAEFHVIADSGHWVLYEFADTFNSILLGILQKRRGAGSV